MQVPYQFWIPEPAEHLRTVDGIFQDVSLAAILNAQLSTESATVMLPKPLLVMHQLSM